MVRFKVANMRCGGIAKLAAYGRNEAAGPS